MPPIPSVLSVDVEDYFQVSAFANQVHRKDWDSFPLRVERSTNQLLELFAARNQKGTFFVLGWVAERLPQLVQRIAQEGHELASHGFWHELVYNQSPDVFREDVRRSREVLQQVGGVSVTAYRAPSFSITARSMWALDVLVEEGFTSDSSIFPIRHDRYGVPGAVETPHVIQTAAGPITEFPPTFARFAGRLHCPIGGGYFRILPFGVSTWAISKLVDQGRPAMFYLHPWEIDPDQPRISGVSMRSRFRHYTGLHRTQRRLNRLLAMFPFTTMSDALTRFLPALDRTPVATISKGI
jgi:polysaccharide deacetylase family protein (PEP-CTERM system associated)